MIFFKSFGAALAMSLSALLQTTQAQTAEDITLPGYARHEFSFPAQTSQLLLVDADKDGLKDIFAVNENLISVYFQRHKGGFDFSQADTSMSLPGNAIGWDLSDNYSNPQQEFSLLALIDGTRVHAWPIQNRSFGQAEEIISGLGGFLGKGSYQLNFSRDINDDGLDDLIVPGAGEMMLYIRNQDGSYQSGLGVLSDMQINTNLNADGDLERDLGQSLTIPMMELRDVNGDGLPDLISDTEERFDVFLASSGRSNQYFPPLPTFTIDRLEIRERLGEFDVDQLDFSNLTGVLALTHEEVLEDVNGDGIDDMLLREGGKVSLFLGSKDGIRFEQPQQVLRSGGNVLTTFLYDENEDDLKDLWLWRVEPISVGDLFVWLAISGSINVEAFVYPNEGQRFASRPARKVTVALKFPSAVRMISSVLDVRERARSMSDTVVPTALASVNGMSSNHDLLVLLEDQVQVFFDAIQKDPPPSDDRFLASLNYSRSRDNYEIDIRSIIDNFEIEQNRELRQVEGREPDVSVALNGAMRNGDIITSDLNANGLDDVFVFMARDKDVITGILLLSERSL
jgi:hypothetical protein